MPSVCRMKCGISLPYIISDGWDHASARLTEWCYISRWLNRRITRKTRGIIKANIMIAFLLRAVLREAKRDFTGYLSEPRRYSRRRLRGRKWSLKERLRQARLESGWPSCAATWPAEHESGRHSCAATCPAEHESGCQSCSATCPAEHETGWQFCTAKQDSGGTDVFFFLKKMMVILLMARFQIAAHTDHIFMLNYIPDNQYLSPDRSSPYVFLVSHSVFVLYTVFCFTQRILIRIERLRWQSNSRFTQHACLCRAHCVLYSVFRIVLRI